MLVTFALVASVAALALAGVALAFTNGAVTYFDNRIRQAEQRAFDDFKSEHNALTEAWCETRTLAGRVARLERLGANLAANADDHDRELQNLAAATAGIEKLRPGQAQ